MKIRSAENWKNARDRSGVKEWVFRIVFEGLVLTLGWTAPTTETANKLLFLLQLKIRFRFIYACERTAVLSLSTLCLDFFYVNKITPRIVFSFKIPLWNMSSLLKSECYYFQLLPKIITFTFRNHREGFIVVFKN